MSKRVPLIGMEVEVNESWKMTGRAWIVARQADGDDAVAEIEYDHPGPCAMALLDMVNTMIHTLARRDAAAIRQVRAAEKIVKAAAEAKP